MKIITSNEEEARVLIKLESSRFDICVKGQSNSGYLDTFASYEFWHHSTVIFYKVRVVYWD